LSSLLDAPIAITVPGGRWMPATAWPFGAPLPLNLFRPERVGSPAPDAFERFLTRVLREFFSIDAYALFAFAEPLRSESLASHGFDSEGLARVGARLAGVRSWPDTILIPIDALLGERAGTAGHVLVLRDADRVSGALVFRGATDLASGASDSARETSDPGRRASDGARGAPDPDGQGPLRASGSPIEALAGVLAEHVRAHRGLAGTLRAYEFARAILRDVSSGLIAVERLGRVIYLNPAAEQILGASAEEAVGADALRVFRTLIDGENVLLEGLKGDMPEMEVWVRRQDGREIPVELRLSQIRASDGGVLGAVAIFRDLSEIKKLEERTRHRDRLATVGELAAGIAHEIGNPLTGIRGCAQILRDRLGADDPAQEFVNVILEEVDRLGRLANQVRHYVRPGSPRMQKGSVGRCIEQVLALVRQRADEAGITIHLEIPGDLPEIYHDPDQIQQVLHNLVLNAIQAMTPGGGRLEIAGQSMTQLVPTAPREGRRAGDRFGKPPQRVEKAFVRVRVTDTGVGIEEEHLQRIFHPFFTTKPDGLGLGLSVSQTIVAEHGGFLSVVSQRGKGTTFFVDLPVDRRTP
jgi:two-component system sensor histidine kinase AtoS